MTDLLQSLDLLATAETFFSVWGKKGREKTKTNTQRF